MEKLKKHALNLLHEGPMRTVELVVALTQFACESSLDPAIVIPSIESYIKEGSIIELEYILPKSNYKIRSMLFVSGTELRVNAN
jgi:hypothetical protein